MINHRIKLFRSTCAWVATCSLLVGIQPILASDDHSTGFTLARAIPTDESVTDDDQNNETEEAYPLELGKIYPVISNNLLQYYEKDRAFASDPRNQGTVNFFYNSWRLMGGKIDIDVSMTELPQGEPFYLKFVWAGFSKPDRTWVTVLFNGRKLNKNPHPVRGHAWGNPENFILKVKPKTGDYEATTGVLTIQLDRQSSMVLFMQSISILKHSKHIGVVSGKR